MKYIELKNRLKDMTVFSVRDIEKSADKVFHRRRLNEWQEKDYIKKLVKGYYIFSDMKVDDYALYEIANRIYSPSYISLETALSYHGLIPESVYLITSVSTRKTNSFKTPLAIFGYRKIKSSLFFGYIIEEDNNRVFKMASPEKAILDLFYLKPDLKGSSDFSSLRINNDNFKGIIDRKKLFNYLKIYNNKRMSAAIKKFWGYMYNA
ncbi:MAG: type IV toxin-antitoxin system AbiEi family antitoxin domain-containing protein [Actinomycetota bacterium]